MKVFNGHSDIITALHYARVAGEENFFKNHFYDNFKKGNVVGSIFVLWTDEAHMSDYKTWVEEMLKSVALEFEENSDIIKQILTVDAYYRGIEEGKLGVILGMEGLAHIREDIGLIEKYYYENGLRHVSLTWNEENPLAKGPHFQGGLSKLGKEAVKLLQDLGVLVDVSHLNDDGIYDMLSITTKPIMASHSNARALADVKRNLKDDQIIEIAKTGGIIGLNAAGSFVSDKKEEQTPEGLINQLDYLVEKAGIDTVTFGFDFMDFLPEEAMGTMKPDPGQSATMFGLEDESDIPSFIELIRARGYSEEDIEKIAFKNYERFLKERLS